MRKVIIVFVSLLTVCITCGIIYFILSYTGVFENGKVVKDPVRVYYNEDGYKYTESDWTWKPVEGKVVISYHNNVSTAKKRVTLVFSDSEFYGIDIPDVPYIYDFGKTVWAVDGSFMIRVVGDATVANLAQLAGIDGGENMNQYTIRNKDGVKGQRVLATLIGSTAVIVNVYSGDDNYSILFDSIVNNRDTYTVTDVPYAKSCKTLSDIAYQGQFTQSVFIDDEVTLYQNKYLFEDGSLWSQGVMTPFDVACDSYLIKIASFSKTGKIEEVYNNGSVMYARSGDYYTAVISYNANTCLTMVGEGEEANCNIIWNIAQLR